MAVVAYVNRDPAGHPWPPVYEHEASAAIGLIQRLFEIVGQEPVLYLVFVNLQAPHADLVVASELGMGVIELKHYAGHLSVQDNIWYAGTMMIRGGVGYANPREQVQAYASRLHRKVSPYLANCWGANLRIVEQQARIQSAVCFTNPRLEIDAAVKQHIEYGPAQSRLPPFGFKLLVPADFAAWAVALRFGLEQDRAAQFAPYRLTEAQLTTLAQSLLHSSEWTEIRKLMPTGQPFAYLVLAAASHEQPVFPLRTIETYIGRDGRQCAITLPEQYRRVSRQHARFVRVGGALWIEDLASTHGTYVNGARIQGATQLNVHDLIMLGGPAPCDEVSQLIVTSEIPHDLQASSTMLEVESGTAPPG
jgi:FHA domain/Nuclease-related domain